MLDVLLMIVSALIIILSLIQGGKSDGISGAFTGGSSLNLFTNVKERGPEKILSNITTICGILFFTLIIILRVF